MDEINIFIAFGAGFLSFISPCVLPLYPAFLSYITGMSVSEIKEENTKMNKKALLHTIFFLIGFSSIFIMIGFTASAVSEFLLTYQDIIRQIGAVLIVFFGLVIVGVLNFNFLIFHYILIYFYFLFLRYLRTTLQTYIGTSRVRCPEHFKRIKTTTVLFQAYQQGEIKLIINNST